MGTRYPALEFIIKANKLLAFVVGGVLIAPGVMALTRSGAGGTASDFAGGIAVLFIVGGLIAFASIWASGELLQVLIDIESNTRKAAMEREKASNDNQPLVALSEGI